jgi:hypothetical protein
VLLPSALNSFRASAAQCASLVSNAHRMDSAGTPFLPPIDQQQITVAAFLNLFVAWETYLEEAFAAILLGESTLSGRVPVKYASAMSADHARRIVEGARRYFDYGNHEHFRKLCAALLDSGYPFEPHMGSIVSDLQDLRTMRNSAAHVSTSTQSALEALATRLLGSPQPGINLYSLLLRTHPRSGSGSTVFGHASDTLLAAAQLMATG